MMQSLVARLTVVLEGVGAYREAIEDFFARLPAAQWIRTLPIGDHGITAPTLWARLGDAPGRWESFRHLQAQAWSRAGDQAEREAAAGRALPRRLRQGVAVRGRSGRVPLAPVV